MARDKITDKSNPPKSEWFGYKYKVNPESSKLLQEAVFKDGGRWGGGQTHILYLDEKFIQVTSDGKMWRGFSSLEDISEPEKQPPQVELPQPKKEFQQGKWYKCVDRSGVTYLTEGKWYKCLEDSKSFFTENDDRVTDSYYGHRFDINSESDFNPDTVDPYKHTAYVKFKGHSGKYDSKEYCYKCDDSVLSVYDSRALMQHAKVDVNGEIKTVQIQRISKDYLDSKATKCIIGIVEDEKGKLPEATLRSEYMTTQGLGDLQPPVSLTEAFVAACKKIKACKKIERDLKWPEVTCTYVSQFKPDNIGSKSGNNATTNVGDVNMTQVTRKVYSVQLIDGDAGLPVELSLVHDFKTVITEDDIETTKQQLLADIDLAKILKDHNAKRTAQVNLDIQNRTGNSVKLLPITKVKELTWSFK